jgi:hypothetical protein
MSYNRQTFTDGSTPILNADVLNNMEDGISKAVRVEGFTSQNADLNTIISQGIYRLSGLACVNIPEPSAGPQLEHSILRVSNISGAVVQELIPTNNIAYPDHAGLIYTRTSLDSGSTWCRWIKYSGTYL